MKNAAAPALVLVLLVAGPAASQQAAPTPSGERVVVPSLPDQKNKEGVVSPTGGMKTDNEGYVRNNPAAVDPNAKSSAAGAGGGSGASTGAVAPGPGIVPAMPSPSEGPGGPAVVETAQLMVKGVVKSFDKKSITVTETNGKVRTFPLTAKAEVYEGLAVGDRVVVRIPLKKPADGKSADRVEKQKPPKPVPKSKFAAQQTPG